MAISGKVDPIVQPNPYWSMDFMNDTLSSERTVRALIAIIDFYSMYNMYNRACSNELLHALTLLDYLAHFSLINNDIELQKY